MTEREYGYDISDATLSDRRAVRRLAATLGLAFAGYIIVAAGSTAAGWMQFHLFPTDGDQVYASAGATVGIFALAIAAGLCFRSDGDDGSATASYLLLLATIITCGVTAHIAASSLSLLHATDEGNYEAYATLIGTATLTAGSFVLILLPTAAAATWPGPGRVMFRISATTGCVTAGTMAYDSELWQSGLAIGALLAAVTELALLITRVRPNMPTAAVAATLIAGPCAGVLTGVAWLYYGFLDKLIELQTVIVVILVLIISG